MTAPISGVFSCFVFMCVALFVRSPVRSFVRSVIWRTYRIPISNSSRSVLHDRIRIEAVEKKNETRKRAMQLGVGLQGGSYTGVS